MEIFVGKTKPIYMLTVDKSAPEIFVEGWIQNKIGSRVHLLFCSDAQQSENAIFYGEGDSETDRGGTLAASFSFY
jgi:hypothetical protein